MAQGFEFNYVDFEGALAWAMQARRRLKQALSHFHSAANNTGTTCCSGYLSFYHWPTSIPYACSKVFSHETFGAMQATAKICGTSDQ